MDNPFDQILQELSEIKETISVIRTVSTEPAEIIDRKELLIRLGITHPTAVRYGKKGIIPTIKIGTAVKYNWPSVVKALETQKN